MYLINDIYTYSMMVLDINIKIRHNSQMNLRKETVALLTKTDKTQAAIAKKVGISTRVLYNITKNKDINFGVDTIQAIYDYLKE